MHQYRALLALGTDPTALHSPPADTPITLARLLRGLLPLAETAERWDLDYNALYNHGAPGADQRLRRLGGDPITADRHDIEDLNATGGDLIADLGDTEKAFTGFGCVGELFTAVATGDH
ncbi:hypothetical protein AWN90_11865 [Nocardia terpenica]|uniref:Uncharacterized protein n=1 Tax=Nocardia terpenica TaxID=455432 RepID=A0A164HIP8_9NOCA|nr:hypothetical protein AWN90_11865 [Nocardia terpenica]